MKKILFLIVLPTILFISCVSNKNNNNTTMEQEIKTEEKYEVLVIYTRQERSKDSNGTENKISLNNKTLSYYERHWGFKASKRITEKEIEITDEFLDYINSFIKNELPNKTYSKEIEKNRERAFNTFRYELFIDKNDKKYKIDISTKNHNTDNKYYNNLETLFSEMKSKFKIKGKY